MIISNQSLLKVEENDIIDGVFTTPEEIDTIKSYAFRDLQTLKKIIVTDNVKNINTRSFYSCPNLTSIKIKDEIFEGFLLSMHYCFVIKEKKVNVYDVYNVKIFVNMVENQINFIEHRVASAGKYKARGAGTGYAVVNLADKVSESPIEERLEEASSFFEQNKKYSIQDYGRAHFILVPMFSCPAGREEFFKQQNVENWEGTPSEMKELYQQFLNTDYVKNNIKGVSGVGLFLEMCDKCMQS